MGTFIKYLIYIVLVVAVFFILKGLWDGELIEKTENKANNTIQQESSVSD